MGSKKALVSGATPPLISQLAFSVVSFFSVAGLSRQSSQIELASVIAAYSLESIAVSWGNARWASLLVFREARAPRQGDISVMTRAFLLITACSFPPLLGAALLVDRSWTIALWAAVWSCSMLLGDLFRYAGSRFLTIRPIAIIGGLHLVTAVGSTFVKSESVPIYLAVLSALSLLAGLGYFLALRGNREPGRSDAWETQRHFALSMGQEAVLTSGATGVGGAAVSTLNPGLAVGLQLGNQILGMPANVLANSFALPLSRKLREWMDGGTYPRKLLVAWAGFAGAIPVLGVIALWLLRPLIEMLLGERAGMAYYYLPVVFLQTIMILPWQPFTSARRWTHGPDNPRHHAVITVALFYAILVGIGALRLPDSGTRLWLLVCTGVLVLSTIGRSIAWCLRGPSWSGVEPPPKGKPRRAAPPPPAKRVLVDSQDDHQGDSTA